MKFNELFNRHFPWLIFLSILRVKTGELEVNYSIAIEKWYNRWLRLLTMLLPGRICIALGPWHFGDFRNIFLPNIGENQKKSYELSAGPQKVMRHIMVNPALVNALRS